MAIQTITQNRYTTYALGLAVLCFTGYRLLTNQINWVGNWPLWDAVRWSDISMLELDRTALVLSRLLAVGLAVFLVVLTLALFRRREWDATRIVHRLRPRRSSLATLTAGSLGGASRSSPASGWRSRWAGATKAARPRSRQRITGERTWPRIATPRCPISKHVALELDLFPERSRYHVAGTYDLINPASSRSTRSC